MFERGRNDNSHNQVGMPVEIALANGEIVKGKLLIAISSKLADILNGTLTFLEVESYAGERWLLAKSAITSVRPVNPPHVANLTGRSRDEEFDPYRILRIAPGVGREEMRQAYLRQAKAYHPDRYANAELPSEVCDYLAAMARRINAAYASLDETLQVKRQAAEAINAPVYTSGAR